VCFLALSFIFRVLFIVIVSQIVRLQALSLPLSVHLSPNHFDNGLSNPIFFLSSESLSPCLSDSVFSSPYLLDSVLSSPISFLSRAFCSLQQSYNVFSNPISFRVCFLTLIYLIVRFLALSILFLSAFLSLQPLDNVSSPIYFWARFPALVYQIVHFLALSLLFLSAYLRSQPSR
jgi:hypothetical protein